VTKGLLKIAASLESKSEHPIAWAIVEESKKKRLRRAIQNYLFKKYLTSCNWRADLIAIDIVDKKIDIRHYECVSL